MSVPICSLGNSFERLTMKRLLLSTTLILGTVTGVKAADFTPASAEALQRSSTELETHAAQLSATIDVPPTQVGSAISPISAVEAFNNAKLSVLSELDKIPPNQTRAQTNLTILKSQTPTTDDMVFFNTQKTIDIFLSDIVRQSTFSWPRFETAMVFLCILSHLYVHWISDDPTKISSYDKSRIAVPITSALTVKALDSARKIWNDYHKSLAPQIQAWKVKLHNPTTKYQLSFLLACAFINKRHLSEEVIKSKLQEVFRKADDFTSIASYLP